MTTDTAQTPDNGVVGKILQLREHNPSARAGMRYGAVDGQEYRSYPWLGTSDVALQLFAALASTYNRVGHDNNEYLPRFVRRVALRTSGEEAVWARLTAAASGDLRLFDSSIRGLVRQGGMSLGLNINWFDVWHYYRNWDHQDRDKREAAREQLLQRFWWKTREEKTGKKQTSN